ncbi:MAG: NAD-dependent epimerase/dehydratase family protein [Thermoleophilaceae bacterium]|nr:NAD-dependent epimerase/dehydratase family protein [Thermoleophilaceae bacterium]
MAAPILVTGASGAIGSRVVEQLRGQGRPVRCLVRRRPVANADELVRGNLGDGSTLDAAVQGAEVVLHLAAVTHARRSRDYVETNLIGTKRLLEAAARHGVRRFVHVSTRAISEAGGAYSVSKHLAEHAVRDAPVEHTIVRLPEVYGGAGAEGIDQIVSRARRGAAIPVVGDGADRLCPMHVDDAVAALAGAVGAPVASGRTYTLGGECLTTREFAEACARAFSSESRQRPVPVTAVAALGLLGRVLPLPIYPDQLARLRAEKPQVSPEAERELGFRARPLAEGLASLL